MKTNLPAVKQLLLARNRSPSQFHGRRQQLPRNRIRWKSWVCILPKNSNIRNHRQSTRQMWNRRIRRILPNLKNTRVTSNSDLEGWVPNWPLRLYKKNLLDRLFNLRTPIPDLKSEDTQKESREEKKSTCDVDLSTSLELADTGSSKRSEPNIKHTKEKCDHSEFGKISPVGTESWTCQLCPGPTYSSVSGMRKHYWSHYRVWSASKNVLRDMDKDKRKHQDALKAEAQERKRPEYPSASETGAKKIVPKEHYHHRMAKKKIPAAAGAPSSTDGEDESMRPPVEAPPSRIDTLNTTPSRSLSDLADPTVRNRRSQLLSLPIGRIRIGRIWSRVLNAQSELWSLERSWFFQRNRFLQRNRFSKWTRFFKWNRKWRLGYRRDGTDGAWSNSARRYGRIRPKSFIAQIWSGSVVSKIPTLLTLRHLLLYGVPAVMQEARGNSTRPLTALEESHLEQMYNTMLATVPLVRALDTMKD